jgi:hypothetical protein
MRRIRGEIALNPESLFKPVQALIDRRHQGAHLAGNFGSWQPQAGTGRSDLARDLRGLPERAQCAAEDGDISDQQHQKDGQCDPSDVPVKIGDDIVDQHVAVGEVFAGLDPDGPIAYGFPDAGARHRGVAAPLLQKLDRGGPAIVGKQGCGLPTFWPAG